MQQMRLVLSALLLAGVGHVQLVDIPSVSVALENATRATGEAVNMLQISCDFTPMDNNDTNYTVYWYVDNRLAKMSDGVTKFQLDQARLNETELEQLGVTITCLVVYDSESPYNTSSNDETDGEGKWEKLAERFRVNPKGDSRYPRSEPFFAGIKILNPRIEANRGDIVNVSLQLTVPFGCSPGSMTCALTVLFSDPDVSNCAGSVGITGSQSCGLTINSDQWDDVYTISITVKDSGTYQLLKPFYTLQLSTADYPSHPIWSNYTEEVIIGLDNLDVTWQGKDCHSVIDPHTTVFDGRRYEQHNVGEFIMYQHQSLDLQVNMKTETCGLNPTPTCGCGVAVRAGADVFVIDTCEGETFIGYLNCTSNALDVRKLSETRYAIYFPTGTYVSVQMFSNKFMNIHVYPSVRDVNSVRGLCGNLNGTCDDDFELRDGTYSSVATANANCNATYRWYPDDFSISWMVGIAESLFYSSSFVDALTEWGLGTELKVCTCTGSSPPVIECSYSNVETCSRDGDDAVTCPDVAQGSLKRRKRSLLAARLELPAARQRLVKRKADAASSTEEERRTLCKQFLEGKPSYQICGDIENVNKDAAVEICMLDIELMRNTDWMLASLEALKDKCRHEMKMNLDLWTPSADGTSIAENIRSSLCENECSGHGNCTEGECSCDVGFGASDCSEDLSLSPVLDDSQGDVKCDVATAECTQTSVFGETFVISAQLTCRLTLFKNNWNGERIYGNTTDVTGQHISLFEVLCHLPEISSDDLEEGIYSYGYKISISNDGNVFSDDMTITMYDSRCLSPKSDVDEDDDRRNSRSSSSSSSSEESDELCKFSVKRGQCAMKGSCRPIVLVKKVLHCRYCSSELPRKEKDCRKKRFWKRPGRWGKKKHDKKKHDKKKHDKKKPDKKHDKKKHDKKSNVAE